MFTKLKPYEVFNVTNKSYYVYLNAFINFDSTLGEGGRVLVFKSLDNGNLECIDTIVKKESPETYINVEKNFQSDIYFLYLPGYCGDDEIKLSVCFE